MNYRELVLVLALCAPGCGSGGAESERTSGEAPVSSRSAALVADETTWVLEDQLIAGATETPVGFSGYALPTAVDGDLLAIGFPTENDGHGAVYTYAWNGTIWILQTKLQAPKDVPCATDSDGVPDLCNYGFDVALSNGTLIVGAPASYNVSGAAYIYSRVSESWGMPRRLMPTGPSEWFGGNVAISADTAVVTTTRATHVFVRQGEEWTLEQKLNGYDVVGAHPRVGLDADTLAFAPISNATAGGNILIYARRGSTWRLQPQLQLDLPSHPYGDVHRTLHLSGDMLVAGSFDKLSVFARHGSGWQFTQTLTESHAPPRQPMENLGKELVASQDTILYPAVFPEGVFARVRAGSVWKKQHLPPGGQSYDRLFQSSFDGKTALVSTDVFVRGGSSWRHTQRLKLFADWDQWPDWPLRPIQSVAASGERVTIASIGSDGSVEGDVFLRSGSVWFEEQHLSIPGATSGAYVSMSDDRLLLSPGSPSASTGARSYLRNGSSWVEEHEFRYIDGSVLAGPVSLSGATALIGVPERNAAHVFVQSDSVWIPQTQLAAAVGDGVASFGASVSLSGDVAVVGAPLAHGGAGAAYVFARQDTSWVLQQKLRPANLHAGALFGFSVSLSGDALVVGSPAYGHGTSKGVVYEFVRQGSSWIERDVPLVGDVTSRHFFGYSVSLMDDTLVIGATGHDAATHLFVRSDAAWVRSARHSSMGVPGESLGGPVAAGPNVVVVGGSHAAYVFGRRYAKPVGAACSSATDCESGFCASGVCCDRRCDSECQSCAGYVTGLADGTCSQVPAGTRCGPDPQACASPSRYATMPTCDVAGRCHANSSECGPGLACVSTPNGGQCAVDCAESGTYEHALCARTHWCAPDPTRRLKGICVPDLRGATACTSPDQCASDACVAGWCSGAKGDPCDSQLNCSNGLTCRDGYCCDSACSGICEACDVPGHEGTCKENVGSPKPGHGYCQGAGTDCSGTCDGSTRDVCSYPVGKPCGSGTTCNVSAATQYGFMCNSAGRCEQSTAGRSCFPYVSCANPETCMMQCGSSRDCVSTHFCEPVARKCVQKLPNGSACAGAGECSSGYCVDGVCCDQECDGACEACSLGVDDTRAGQCRAVEGTPIGARQACGGSGACAGYCNGSSRECFYPGAARSCAAASCTGALLTPVRGCDGAGQCAPASPQACAHFLACDGSGSACKGGCTSDRDCANGAKCAPDTRQCILTGAGCEDAFNVRHPNGDVQSCQGHVCIAGQCASGCSDDSQCALDYSCRAGRCQERSSPKPDAGAPDGGEPPPDDPDGRDGCACRAAGAGDSSGKPVGGDRGVALMALAISVGAAVRRRARKVCVSHAAT